MRKKKEANKIVVGDGKEKQNNAANWRGCKKNMEISAKFHLFICQILIIYKHLIFYCQHFMCTHTYIYIYIYDVMVIVVGNEHGDTSSNPGRGWLHFT